MGKLLELKRIGEFREQNSSDQKSAKDSSRFFLPTSSPASQNWEPAVKRQPGYRRGPRRALFFTRSSSVDMKEASGARPENSKNHVFLFLSNVGSPKCFDSNTAATDLRMSLADAAQPTT
eukprot:6201123-Pyramimonas_sp.AAC.1